MASQQDSDKYVGLTLALSSAFLTGASFIITKKGLQDTKREGGLFELTRNSITVECT